MVEGICGGAAEVVPVSVAMPTVLGASTLTGTGVADITLFGGTESDTSTLLSPPAGFALVTGSWAIRSGAMTIAGSAARTMLGAAMGFAATGGWAAQAPRPAQAAVNRTRLTPARRRAAPGG